MGVCWKLCQKLSFRFSERILKEHRLITIIKLKSNTSIEDLETIKTLDSVRKLRNFDIWLHCLL
jgi:hypothetical protein